MSDNVRVGIIGTSWWAEAMYLPSLRSHPSAELVAICGRNRERGEEMAEKYGVPKVFTDYRELLTKADIDAVVVATPDDLHFLMTMAALTAGLHVLCEKPLALNADHAKQMYEKAQAAQVKHMVLFTWRWQPHFRYLKHLLDEGYIGRCYHASFRFLGGYGRAAEYEWRFDGRRANGIVGDLGAHMIDLARWYFGDISKVSANLKTHVERPSADERPSFPANDAAFITLQFDNQAQAMIQVSAVAHQADRNVGIHIELHGESGTLEANHIFFGAESGATLRGARRDEEQFSTITVPEHLRKNLDPADPFAPYTKQSAGPRLFIDSILEDEFPSPSFYDGWKVQEVIDAVLESHRNERWVSLTQV